MTHLRPSTSISFRAVSYPLSLPLFVPVPISAFILSPSVPSSFFIPKFISSSPHIQRFRPFPNTFSVYSFSISKRNSIAMTSTLSPSSGYDQLVKTLQTITHLERASAVVDYDEKVFMPTSEQAVQDRAAQQAALATVIHEKSIDPKIGELLQQAEKELQDKAQLNEDDQLKQRVLKLAKKAYYKKICISTELAARKAALSSQAYNTWAKARTADDYSQFQPIFKQCIDLAIEITKAQQNHDQDPQSLPKSLYAEMLDEYEVGMSPERIDAIFVEIKAALVPLIGRVLGPHATPPSTQPLQGHFPLERQEPLNKVIVQDLGFNTHFGRIDVSVHPFTMGISKNDVRITSRFREDEWYQGLAGSIHEAGHAMYEQNLPNRGLPTDAALSMGMHESQSLFWERHIGLSKSFWTYATPIVNQHLHTSFSVQQLYGAVNAVSRSFIRVEADELTYPLHVILRYEIERDLIQGTLTVDQVPQRWNQDMKALLQVDVPSDAKGCLQDVHWSMLAYGYFPTYLIGAAAAAQLAHYAQKQIPEWNLKIEAGNFEEIKAWLVDKVHRYGSFYESLDQQFEDQLGEKLNPKYFIDYLTQKYIDLYQC